MSKELEEFKEKYPNCAFTDNEIIDYLKVKNALKVKRVSKSFYYNFGDGWGSKHIRN
jgi:hypothetical protein